MHQVEQGTQGRFRATFVGPDDDLGREHVDIAQLGNPRRGGVIPAADDEVIDAVRPLVGGGQRGRRGAVPTAVHGETVCDDVEQTNRPEFFPQRRTPRSGHHQCSLPPRIATC